VNAVGEAIVVTSGKGGVGKTTTSANIGASLALRGKKVCLVDTDIGLRNLDVVMGLENRIVYHLLDVIEGKCRVQQALIKDKRFDELYLLPAAQTKDKDDVTPERVREIIEELKQLHDYVIIDCPAGIEQGFRNAIAGADHAIVVTTPENAAVRDADRIIGLLDSANIRSPKLVVNRIRPNMVKQGDMLDVDQIHGILSIEILGIVPDDENVIAGNQSGVPAVLNGKTLASKAYQNIGRRILGDKLPLMSLEEKPTFMKKMKKFLGIG
jgi:septum site-determining protein MinD